VTILATQKPTSDSLPTDIRDNASLRVCFGVQSTYAASAVLGDDWSAASSVSPLGASVGIGVAAVDGKFVRFRAPYIPESTIARQMNDCAVLCLDPWQLLDAQLTRTA
jgi:DNA segregation ATPase FtsK/SpoIIIE-like protein